MIAMISVSLPRSPSPLRPTCNTGAFRPSPLGVWIDHTGRGAVEITDCGGKLCGRIVWVKDPAIAKVATSR